MFVVYYVDKSKFDRKINFYGKLEEVVELVVKDFFLNSEKLFFISDFDYLI